MPEDIQKVNIRSPFFITATGEGAPEDPATPSDPITDPTTPTEYVQPETLTQNIICGETIKVGEDVGGKRYLLNVGTATGNINISYTVNIPISIIAYWNQTVPDFQNTGYVGNNLYEQDLLDAGISAGNMNLGSGTQSGTVTINKTAATPETVAILVSAPLKTDDYQLTFGCPTAPAVPTSTLPTPGVQSSGTLFDVVPAFYINVLGNVKASLRVNDVLVNSNLESNRYYAFTDHSSVGPFGIGIGYETYTENNGVRTENTPTTHLAKSTYFNQNINKIEFTFEQIASGQPTVATMHYQKGGIVFDGPSNIYRYITDNSTDLNKFGIKYGGGSKGGFIGDDSIISTRQLYGTPPSGSRKMIFYYRNDPSSSAGLDHPRKPTYADDYTKGTYVSEINSGVESVGSLFGLRLHN
jgi:hypothetical protein